MAFHRGELDSDTAERMLGHRVAPDDAPPGYREVARLLQAANTEAQPHAVKDDAIVGAMVDAIVSPPPETITCCKLGSCSRIRRNFSSWLRPAMNKTSAPQ